MSKYDKIHSRMHQIAAFKKDSRGDILALTLSPRIRGQGTPY